MCLTILRDCEVRFKWITSVASVANQLQIRLISFFKKCFADKVKLRSFPICRKQQRETDNEIKPFCM